MNKKDDVLNELDLITIENISDKEKALIYKELSKIEGIEEYLKSMMANDIKIHFNSPVEQQDLVKGAYHRTAYILNNIKKYSKVT